MSADRPSVRRVRLAPSRVLLLCCYLVLILAQLLQQGTLTTFDTKLDLLVDPGHLLASSLTLWSPQLGMGSLQNQAYGYLFPIGPAFWAMHAVGLPAWLAERLWSAALSVVAFDGARRLGRAWGGLGWRASLVVGLAYVAGPRFLSEIGALSGELLPAALLPWVVLPLVRARRGQRPWPVAVVLSGLAVALMGGLNAAELAATLPLPIIVLWSSIRRGELPWLTLPAWFGAVLAGCAWWLGPLVLLGRYSPPFLDFIESSANTTGLLGWVNATRGADNWVGYLAVGGRPWWPAGYALDRTPWLVVMTALVAAVSLCGLLGSRVRDRGVLLTSVALGLVCMLAGHGGDAGGLVAGQVRDLLDGPLAALRNVHKVDPLVRLPMALGLGYAAHEARVLLADRLRRGPGWLVASAGARAVAVGVVGTVVVGLLMVSAQPVAAQQLRQLPGWTAVPGPWHRAAAAIDGLPATSRVLVVPASGMGLQVWGWTIDEPIQPLTSSAWVSRGQAPLVPPATVRWLDAIEAVLATGHGTPTLAETLARAGITDVLLRTDLDPQASDAPPPSVVLSALQTSPGLSRTGTFGVPPGADLPMQLWHVRPAQPDASRARVVPDDRVRSVQGGPEAVPALLAARLLAPGDPVELVGQLDSPSAGTAPDFLTDTLQRREQSFGRVNEAQSSIMTAADAWTVARGTHEYAAFPGELQTVAYSYGLMSVTATSSAGYADVLGPVRPDEGPYSALDSDDSTAWVSAPFTRPVGQAISVTMRAPVVLHRVLVHLWQSAGGPTVTALRLTTDAGAVTVPVSAGQSAVTIAAPTGATTHATLAVAGVSGGRRLGQVGFTTVALGIDQSRSLLVPGSAGPGTTMLFTSASPQRACTFPARVCNADQAAPAEEGAALDRSFRVAHAGSWRLALAAVARPSLATAQLLQPVQRGFSVTGSSDLDGDPVVAPAFAFDGDPSTTWVADGSDPTPTLTLTWPGLHTLSRIQLGLGTQSGVRLPTQVVITSGSQVRRVSLTAGSLGFFTPLRTHHVTLRFVSGSLSHPLGGGTPMEIPDVALTGLPGLSYAPDLTARTGEPCGFGPPVEIDGRSYPTRVSGTIEQVLAGTPMGVELCGPRAAMAEHLALGAGPHRIRATSTVQFQVVRMVLAPVDVAPASDSASRTLRVDSWGAASRSLRVGPGGASMLWVPENANPGWVATADGAVLPSVSVDGWMQGWRLPAGGAVTVSLRFTPQRAYVAALVGGGVLLLGLFGLGGWLVVRGRRRGRAPAPSGAGRPRSGTGRAWTDSPVIGWVAIVVVGCVGGFAVIAGAVLGSLPGVRRLAVRRSLLVVGLVAAAWWQDGPAPTTGADLVAATAVGIVLAPARATLGRLPSWLRASHGRSLDGQEPAP